MRVAWAAEYGWEDLFDWDTNSVVLNDSTIVGVALAIVSVKGRRRTEAEVNLSCQRWLPCGRYSRSRG